jgi:hypothetical protein
VTFSAFGGYMGAYDQSGCLQRYYDLTDKEGILQNLLLAYTDRNIDRFAELLHDEYLFYLQEGDYMPGESPYLTRQEDIQCTTNMFLAASGQYEPRIDRLELRLDDGVWSSVSEIGGEPCEDCWMTQRHYSLLVGINEVTYIANDIAVFCIKPAGPDEDSGYKILRIFDVMSSCTDMGALGSEENSWGAIKLLFLQ